MLGKVMPLMINSAMPKVRTVTNGQGGRFQEIAPAMPDANSAAAANTMYLKVATSPGIKIFHDITTNAPASTIHTASQTHRAAANHLAAKTSVRRCQLCTSVSA